MAVLLNPKISAKSLGVRIKTGQKFRNPSVYAGFCEDICDVLVSADSCRLLDSEEGSSHKVLVAELLQEIIVGEDWQ